MNKRRTIVTENEPDFELIFSATGSVELIEIDDGAEMRVWASDDDEEFAESFDGDFFDASDAEEIIEYLIDASLLDDDDAIDILEEDADEDEDSNVIDAEFTEVRKRKSKQRRGKGDE